MEAYQVRYMKERGLLDDIDVRFSEFMARLDGGRSGRALAAAVLLLNNTLGREQHVCLDLAACAGRRLADIFSDVQPRQAQDKPLPFDEKLPELEEWLEALEKSPVVGPPGRYAPLILDRPGKRLYLYRYHDYEQKLAAAIGQRLEASLPEIDEQLLGRGLTQFFPAGSSGSSPDWQKVAAFAALTRNFCVISGGPGTGKTHTVTAVIALMLAARPESNIALAAPTGKAAARLRQSITAAVAKGKGTVPWPENMPDTAVTIHRLLGGSPAGPGFRYHAGNRLPVEALIVDEASMVSMTLMSRLLQALPESAAVILLGDRHQLASVEAGAVLGDICRAAAVDSFSGEFREQYAAVTGESLPPGSVPVGRLDDSVVELQKSYRFSAGSSIDIVSRAVQQGEGERVPAMPAEGEQETVVFRDLPPVRDLAAALKPYLDKYIRPVFQAAGPTEGLALVEKFRILCAHKRGFFGSEGINRLVTSMLIEEGLVDSSSVYRGRPVIVSGNDYRLNLFNGDVGVFWDYSGDMRAWFPGAEEGLRHLPVPLLPEYETVYAMTVHKSQGSEFERVLIILPDMVSSVLSRELLYTGISRAVNRVDVWAAEEVLQYTVNRRVERRSGLKEALVSVYPSGESP